MRSNRSWLGRLIASLLMVLAGGMAMQNGCGLTDPGWYYDDYGWGGYPIDQDVFDDAMDAWGEYNRM